MKKKRFSVGQMGGILRQAEVGVPVRKRVKQVEISEQTFYRWKKRYGKLEVDQVWHCSNGRMRMRGGGAVGSRSDAGQDHAAGPQDSLRAW